MGGEEMDNKGIKGFSEKRRAKRVIVPVKSTALFSDGAGSMDKVYIRDISLVGMLLCDYFNAAKDHPVDSSIYNIYVDIPPTASSNDGGTSFLIEKGKVVRAFVDQSTGALCYGVEFSCESPYIKEKIERLAGNA